MGKKFSNVSQALSRLRGWIQAGAALLTNLHLPNFLKGGLYQGAGKTVCVPGLNCYSCPAASGACPIGAFQAVVGSSKFSFSYYITGFLILLGVLLGRFICGFLCPFGWFQELLHKIPTKKLSTKKLKPLTYLKYAVLLVMVFLLPAFLVNDVGMGDPFFCKYLCPQGVLEGAIPLSLANSGIRAALGSLFTWKFSILLAVIVLSIVFYRPFCKWLCPLGAFYALFNRVSLFQMKVDRSKCVSCGKCAKACKMDVDVTKTPNHTECIRCGMCVRACPTSAVSFRYGFGDGKDKEKAAETPRKNQKFTTVTALPENRVLLSTSFPSRSLPVKAGNFCAVLPSSGGVVMSLPAGTLMPPSSAGAPDKLGNFSSNAASRSSIFLISVAFSFSSSYSSSVNCSLEASMVLSRNSP